MFDAAAGRFDVDMSILGPTGSLLDMDARSVPVPDFAGEDVVLLEPNGDLNGYIEIHGSAEQIAAVHEDEEFQRNTVDASLIVEKLRHVNGVTNDEISRQMAMYQESVGRVPQTV